VLGQRPVERGHAAARVQLAYTHPRTGALTTIEELVRVTAPDAWALRLGEADVVCWGRAAERAAAAAGVRLRLASPIARRSHGGSLLTRPISRIERRTRPVADKD
jgi:hypothetical protein